MSAEMGQAIEFKPQMVGMGEMKIAESSGVLAAAGLGSCVVVALYAEDARLGGLAHIMLPHIQEAHEGSDPARFADTAVALLAAAMEERGARTERLTAKLFGGANMFPDVIRAAGPMDIGGRNIGAVRAALSRLGVDIVAEDVGGSIGRTVHLNVATGSVFVKSVRGDERIY